MTDFSNLKGLFEAAQKIQVEMARVKAELAEKTVSAEAGGGLVQCVVNGKGDVVSLSLDPSLLAGENKRMLEDLAVAAINLALDRARQLAQDEIVKVTGGLSLPPGLFGS